MNTGYLKEGNQGHIDGKSCIKGKDVSILSKDSTLTNTFGLCVQLLFQVLHLYLLESSPTKDETR